MNPHCKIGRVVRKKPDNLTVLSMVTTVPLHASRVLYGALEANLKRATIVGEDESGSFYFASTDADGGTIIWDMEIAKAKLLNYQLGYLT